MSPPGRIIIGFAVVIGLGAILLMLPATTTAPGRIGVMVFTMLLGTLVARRTSMQLRQTVAAEMTSEDFGGLRAVVLRILAFPVTTEAVAACLPRWPKGCRIRRSLRPPS